MAGMIELFLLVLLVTVIVLSIRSGARIEEPAIIHKPGQYHITLAPQLTPAQSFIEQIAGQFLSSQLPHGDLVSLYCEVRDPSAQKYLLAIAWRGGMLYFQAIMPPNDPDSYLNTLREFSEAVLVLHPAVESVGKVDSLRAAVDAVATQSNIIVRVLI